MKKGIIFALSLLTASVFSASDNALLKSSFERGMLPVPTVEKAPVIDGFIDRDWSNFTLLNGFSTDKKLLIPGCEGYVRFSRDKKYLYIGVTTSTPSTAPGGSLQTNISKRDGEVYTDDCVEVYVKVKDTTYILISNAAGTIFDMKRSGPLKNSAWNFKDLKVGTRVENGWWNLELAVPLAEMGNPETAKLNIFRRWSKAGSGALNYSPAALNDKFMFTADLSVSAPAVQELSYGDVLTGDWEFSAQAVNTTKSPLEFEVLLYHHGKGIIREGSSRCTVAPGKTGKLRFNAKITGNRIRILSVLLRGKEGKVRYARRVMVQRGAALGRRPVTGIISIDNAGSGQIYHLPGFKKVVVEFRPARGKSFKKISGKIADSPETDFVFNQNVWKGVLAVPASDGKLPIDMKLTLSNGKVLNAAKVFELQIRKFEWENNSIGKDQIILPPFTPLAVTKNQVSNLTAIRKINALGLYDSLIADKHELLDSPMTLSLSVNGKKEIIRPRSVKINCSKNGYEAISTAISDTASGITINTRGNMNYDGFHWVTLELDAKKAVKIDKLTLSIPLKDAEVPFFHAVANELRTNPAGFLPKGSGLLWGGSKLPRKKHAGEEVLHPQMVPYLWLGADARGISFFMDSTFGCKISRTKDAVRIIRRGSVVTAEIDFINMPVTLKKKRTIEFGFHPTPVKPVVQELRNMLNDCEGKFIPGAVKAQFFMPDVSVNFASRWSKYPHKKDYSFTREFTAALREGNKFDMPQYQAKLAVHKKEIEKRLLKFPGGKERFERQQKQIAAFLKLYTTSKYRGKSLPYCYFDHRLEFLGDPETDYYKSEWWNPAAQSYFAALRTTQTPSNLDYMVYYMDKMVEAGLHGINLDDAYLMPDTNPDTLARIDDEGELHSMVGIRALRELINRLAVVLHKRGKYPMLLNVHMTDALLVPCFAKVTLQGGFELKYGETPHQERFTPDYIRTVGLGLKIGAKSSFLRGIKRQNTPVAQWKAKEKALLRTIWGVLLPFGLQMSHSQNDDILRFTRLFFKTGLYDADSVFFPCWEQKNITAENMLVSYYKKPSSAFVIVSNYFSKVPRKIKLDVDFKALGFSEKARIIDLETKKKVDLNNITINGYDFKLIQIIDRKK